MDETKKYLDLVGLIKYDENIKAYIKSHGSDVTDKLIALIGAAEKGEDEATLLSRIAELEAAVGDISELGENVENLTKAILGEKARAEAAEKALGEAKAALEEKLYGNDKDGEEKVVGDINILDGRLDILEGGEDEAGSIAKAIKDKIDSLDKADTAVAHQFVTAVSEENGLINVSRAALVADDIPELTLAKITDAGTAAAANIATVAIGAEGEDAAALVSSAQVKAYADSLDSASNERLEALEATHAKKTVGEGDAAKEVLKTVAEEVNEAVAALVDGAPDALDTLKEIADWIANQDKEGQVTDAATLIARVETNAKAIADEAERAEGAESDLQDAIDAVEEKVDAFVRITESEIDKLFGEVAEEEENA